MLYRGLKKHFSKIISVDKAAKLVRPGNTLLVGGFGVCGNPASILQKLAEEGKARDLTVVSNNGGLEDYGVGLLVKNKMLRKAVFSYVGENKSFERAYMNGELEFQVTPQGTLAEKIRSGGRGIPAFWTATGVGTLVENGGFPAKYNPGGRGVERYSIPKETRIFDGKKFLLEESIHGDVAIIKAHKADRLGNLQYNGTARNLNEDMATAAKIVIAEVDEIVETGELEPNFIHTPAIYVDYLVKTEEKERPIEKRVFKQEGGIKLGHSHADSRIRIAKRVAKEMKDGMFVNLGIGIPTLVPSFIDPNIQIEIQGENGSLGANGYPVQGTEDPDVINASKECITVAKGAAFFASSESFGQIRGGHLHSTVLGAMQVSAVGDIANWIIPGKLTKGMGGAMDLVASGSDVIVAMEHTARGNQPKILERCSLPLTGTHVCRMLVTDKAVFDFASGRITLKEIAEGLTIDDIKKATGCDFDVHDEIGTF